LLIGGIHRRMQVAHLKLCASRVFWLVAYSSQGHEMLFDARTRSFSALGGVPRRGIYGNMKTAVDKLNKGKGRTVNARFAVMCTHYLFDPDFCNVAAGWEKGIVEKNVQDSRRRIWLDVQECQFHSFEELNAWLGQRCRTLWQRAAAPAIRRPERGRGAGAGAGRNDASTVTETHLPLKDALVANTARHKYQGARADRIKSEVEQTLEPPTVAKVRHRFQPSDIRARIYRAVSELL
jgi:hypothetical protein